MGKNVVKMLKIHNLKGNFYIKMHETNLRKTIIESDLTQRTAQILPHDAKEGKNDLDPCASSLMGLSI